MGIQENLTTLRHQRCNLYHVFSLVCFTNNEQYYSIELQQIFFSIAYLKKVFAILNVYDIYISNEESSPKTIKSVFVVKSIQLQIDFTIKNLHYFISNGSIGYYSPKGLRWQQYCFVWITFLAKTKILHVVNWVFDSYYCFSTMFNEKKTQKTKTISNKLVWMFHCCRLLSKSMNFIIWKWKKYFRCRFDANFDLITFPTCY